MSLGQPAAPTKPQYWVSFILSPHFLFEEQFPSPRVWASGTPGSLPTGREDPGFHTTVLGCGLQPPDLALSDTVIKLIKLAPRSFDRKSCANTSVHLSNALN